MSRLFLSFAVLCLLNACQSVSLKQAYIIPIFDEQVLLSAEPVFLGDGDSLYDDPRCEAPKVWSYEKYSDGAIRVQWLSRNSKKEQLALLDVGLFPVSVPPQAIVVASKKRVAFAEAAPTEIHILSVNSAFLREEVTLIPYHKQKKRPHTARVSN